MNNRKKIEMLFKLHYDAMLRLALMLLHDGELAHDVVHDVFADLIDADIREETGKTLLMGSVRNRCINKLRDIGRRERILNLFMLEQHSYDDDDWPDDETIEKMQHAIADSLTPQSRSVLEMRYKEQMKYREIASRLKISETAVYNHLRSAFETIRKKISDNG